MLMIWRTKTGSLLDLPFSSLSQSYWLEKGYYSMSVVLIPFQIWTPMLYWFCEVRGIYIQRSGHHVTIGVSLCGLDSCKMNIND